MNLVRYLKKKTITTKLGNNEHTSTHYVWIPSIEEMEKYGPNIQKTQMTDFASDTKEGTYWLRDMSDMHSYPPYEHMSCNGEFNSEKLKSKANWNRWTDVGFGVRPAFSINVTEDLISTGILDTIQEVKDDKGNILYHTVEFGEFPQTKTQDWFAQKLEELYRQGGTIYENFETTQNGYTSHVVDNTEDAYIKRKKVPNPEFSYRGEKYVRKLNKQNQPEWFKVEPLKCIITNWDNLPNTINPNGSGSEHSIDVLTEKVINNTPFQLNGHQDYVYHSRSSCTWSYGSEVEDYLNTENCGFLDDAFKPNEEKVYIINNPNGYSKDFAQLYDITFDFLTTITENRASDTELKHMNLLNIAEDCGKKYIYGNWHNNICKFCKNKAENIDEKHEFCISVKEFRRLFGTFEHDFFHEIKFGANRLNAYIKQVENKDVFLPLQFVLEHDCSKIVENYALFKEKLEPLIRDWSAEETSAFLEIADRLGCFSDEQVIDNKNKVCLASERGVRLLEKVLLSGNHNLRNDLNLSYDSFRGSLYHLFQNNDVMNFLEENLEDYLTSFAGIPSHTSYLLDIMEDSNKRENFTKKFIYFKENVYKPYLQNDKFINSIIKRSGLDLTTKQAVRKITRFYTEAGCMAPKYGHIYIKYLCDIHNKFAGTNIVTLNKEDFDHITDYKILTDKVTLLLKHGEIDSLLNWSSLRGPAVNYPLMSCVFKDWNLLKSVYGNNFIENIIANNGINDYDNLYTFAQIHANSKVKYPPQFIIDCDKDILETIRDEKYFNGEVFNKFIKKELDTLPRNIASDLYKFAYSLGCFSDKKILDKKGNETKTTFAQKASITLRTLLKSGELDIYEMHDLFNTLPFIKEPNQEFLTFIGHQDGKELKNFKLLKKFNQKKYGQMASIMTYWDKIKECRTVLGEDGTPKQLNWEDAIRHYFGRNVFANIHAGNEELAVTLAESGLVRQAEFDQAQDLFDKAKENNIPAHILNNHLIEEIQEIQEDIAEDLQKTKNDLDTAYNKNFTWEMLSKKDPRNVIIGLYCGCCATITGAAYGAQIARSTVTAEDVQNMVIRNKQGKIMSKGALYVNKEQGYVVINDFEMDQGYRQHEDRSHDPRGGYYTDAPDSETAKTRQEIFDTYMRGVNAFVEEYDKENPDKPIQMVVVGRLYNRLKKQCEEYEKLTEHLTVPAEYSFEDAKDAQFVLYRREDALKNKSQTHKQEGGLTL